MRSLRLSLVLLLLATVTAAGLLGADAWRKVQGSSLELTGDPSRLYSAPPRLETGAPLDRAELLALLEALDYRAGDGTTAGTYRAADEGIVARLR
jgi:hypothetical protein